MRLPEPKTTRRLIVLALLLAWELLPRLGLVPVLFLPPFTAAVAALVQNAPEYGRHLLVTLNEVFISLLFACGGGVACGLVVGASSFARRLFLPLASGAFAIPLVVLYPLFTAWFGIGAESKIVFASVYGFLPTMLGTAAGVQTIDRHLVVVGRSLGANRWQQIWRIYMPATIPTVLASLRLGGALVIVGVVVAEMLTSTAGIGFLISRYRTLLDSANVYAAILLVLVIVFLFDVLVRQVERRTAGWHQGAQREDAPGTAFS